MSDSQNTMPANNQLAYENVFSTPENTNALYFAGQHPFTGNSRGDNLYQVAVQQNGQWVMEPVYVRWQDSDRQLVVGLHSTGPITGVRLYHAGNSTGFRKPTLFNVSAGTLAHAPEVPVVQNTAWQDITILNPGFETGDENLVKSVMAPDIAPPGWQRKSVEGGILGNLSVSDINQTPWIFAEGAISPAEGKRILYMSDTCAVSQRLSEIYDSHSQYRLTVDINSMLTPNATERFTVRLLAGNDILGETTVQGTDYNGKNFKGTGVTTDPDLHGWVTLSVDLQAGKNTSLHGKALTVELADDGTQNKYFVGNGFGVDNVRLQKLAGAMASFGAPAEGSAAADARGNPAPAPSLTPGVLNAVRHLM